MAIQFHCPSCQATIRVPDAAAGKKGTCPRCNEKLLVPQVAPGSPSSPNLAGKNPESLPTEATSPGLPRLDSLSGSPRPAAVPEQPFPVIAPTPAVGLPPLDSVSGPGIAFEPPRKPRSKKRQTQAAWLAPVLCILCIVGFIAWYTWKAQPKLEGTLVAQVVHHLDVEPALISGELSGLKPDDLEEVLRRLKAEPMTWASTTSRFTLKGTTESVEVSIRNGSVAHFVSVAPSQSQVLTDYLKQHSIELAESRTAALEKNAPRLYTAWKRLFDKHDPITDQRQHRDLVLIPALVAGLGYHVEAVVHNNIYPCIYEDADGVLYFLLPNATKSFQLRGRTVASGPQVPANFTVKLASTSKTPAARKKSPPKTDEELESENEGMNPDLNKPDDADSASETGDAADMDLTDTPAAKKPTNSPAKSKSSSKKKPAMADDEMMNDEMPVKSLPKKKPTRKSTLRDEMSAPRTT